MSENRISPRYRTLAHGRIPGVMEGVNILKNLSITGCCIECTTVTDIQPDTEYQLEIEPEHTAHIRRFELSVECKWIRSENYSSEIGFSITASPKGKHFQRYVDYLSYRGSSAPVGS